MTIKDKLPKLAKVPREEYDISYQKLIRIAKIYIYQQAFLEMDYLENDVCKESFYNVLNGILYVIRTFYGEASCKAAKIEIDIAMEEMKETLENAEPKNETDICETT